MSMTQKLAVLLITGVIGLCALEFAERMAVPGVHSFVGAAEARVGRPLTPVSVAGVARRTARRCAVGVYYC
jgi:hypothetical protein